MQLFYNSWDVIDNLINQYMLISTNKISHNSHIIMANWHHMVP